MRYMFRAAVIPAAVLAAVGLSLAANASTSPYVRTSAPGHSLIISSAANAAVIPAGVLAAVGLSLTVNASTSLSAPGHPVIISSAANRYDQATATTIFRNVPDSGYYGGNWAVDNFMQRTTVRLIGSVSTSTPGCGTTWTRCYAWTADVRDIGTTTTIPDGAGPLTPGFDPRTGTVPEKVTETLSFRGGSPNVVFFANTNKAYGYLVPRAENAMYNTAPTDERNPFPYVARFFPIGTGITPINGTGWSNGYWLWTYTLPAGGDSQCPSYGPVTWTDGWNIAAADSGNIYAYDASTCPAL
jgi:hypothetical protein